MGYIDMRSVSVTLAYMLLCSLLLPQTTADSSYQEEITDGIRAEFSPISLTLPAGEKGTFDIHITNENNVTYYVEIILFFYLMIGCSHAEAEPTYLEIGSGSTSKVQVTVFSNARRGQGDWASDVNIRMYWSTVDDPDMWRNDTAEGEWSHTYDVVDHFVDPRPIAAILLIVVPFAMLIIFAVIYWRARRVDDGPPRELGEKH